MRVFDKPHQCVIYLHGNGSCRLEAMLLLEYLIPVDVAVVGFDFSGCGLSEGPYVSLGYHEKEDVAIVYDWIRKNKPLVTTVALWGRSMGSVTAILTAKIIPEIRVLVCDSPFSNLRFLCRKLAKAQYKVPQCLFSMIFCCVRRRIITEAKFDVDDLNIAEEIKTLSPDVSILFLSAKQDQLVDSTHPTLLYNLFEGYKRIFFFDGQHNSARPRDINHLVTRYLVERMDAQEKKVHTQPVFRQQQLKIHPQQIQPRPSTPLNEESEPIIDSNSKIRQQQHTFVEDIGPK